jgi:hypothetical protein
MAKKKSNFSRLTLIHLGEEQPSVSNFEKRIGPGLLGPKYGA